MSSIPLKRDLKVLIDVPLEKENKAATEIVGVFKLAF